MCDHEEALEHPASIAGSILVTHRPPQASILNQKLSNAPKFHICGHIHSRRVARQFPSTMLIQVPTLQDGLYAVFYPENADVRFLSLANRD